MKGAGSLLLLALDFPPSRGGIQTLTWEIYSRLGDLTRVAVAPALPAGAQETAGLHEYPLQRTAAQGGTGARLLPFLWQASGRLARARQPTCLLHCNHVFAGLAGRWLQRRWGLPYVVWVHGEELTKSRYPRLLGTSLAHAAAICSNSAFTEAQVRRLLQGRPAPPLHRIALGAPRAWAATPAAATTNAVPVILTVARLSARDRYKGVDQALHAARELRRRGRAFRYRIVGEGDDRGYLEGLAQQLGLGDCVEFAGAAAPGALAAAYDACDIFLLCSREQESPRGLGFEGFGMALLEAGARGKPVVGGRAGGIPDAVEEGVSGLLVDPQDAAAIADGLERLLGDAALREQLGRQGRARVLARYNWDAAAGHVRELHEELLRR